MTEKKNTDPKIIIESFEDVEKMKPNPKPNITSKEKKRVKREKANKSNK